MNPLSLIDSAARAILGPRPAAASTASAPAPSRASRAAQIATLADADAAARAGPAVSPSSKAAAPVTKPGAAAKATDGTTTTGSTTTGGASASSEAADRFLTLLVAQLRNQDPLNPLDNAQVTTQLAQLSTVTGINRINETLLALGEAQSAARTLQATALLGHDVAVDGNAILLGPDAPAQAGYALAGAATSVVVTIKDAAGVVVRTIDLGAQDLGEQRFAWDGKTDAGGTAAPGKYTFTVTATGKDGPVAASTVTIAAVTGVYASDDGPRLVLGDLGSVGLDDVRTFN